MNPDSFLLGVVVDVCTRSFLLLSDEGEEQQVTCDTLQEFTNVLEFVKTNLFDDQISYAEPAVTLR